jgi:hypothetical protein
MAGIGQIQQPNVPAQRGDEGARRGAEEIDLRRVEEQAGFQHRVRGVGDVPYAGARRGGVSQLRHHEVSLRGEGRVLPELPGCILRETGEPPQAHRVVIASGEAGEASVSGPQAPAGQLARRAHPEKPPRAAS